MANQNKVRRKAKLNSDTATTMLSMEATKNSIKELDANYKIQADGIKELLLQKDIDEIVVDDGQTQILSASVYTKTDVSYDLEKMQQKLSKEQLKSVSDTIWVASSNGLRDFIEAHPELRKELLSFIQKVSAINEKKLATALQYGSITTKDIAGCFSTKNTDVFKMQRIKRPDD